MKKVTSVVSVFAVAAMLAVTGCKKDEPAAAAGAAPAARVAAADAAAPAAPAASAPSTGVAECDSYLAALDKYMTCSKIPQSARDAQAASSKQMRAAWNWSNLPEASRKAAQDAAKSGCSQAHSALQQSGKALGCPVD
jgi:hypothetical protein